MTGAVPTDRAPVVGGEIVEAVVDGEIVEAVVDGEIVEAVVDGEIVEENRFVSALGGRRLAL